MSVRITGRIYQSEAWKTWTVLAEQVEALPGEYFAEFLDEQNNVIGVARDLLGLMPVYYTLNPELKIHRTLKSAANSLSNVTLNKNYILAITERNTSLLSETPFNEVKNLPPGHLLYKNNNQWEIKPYFKKLEACKNANLEDVFRTVIKERALANLNFLLSLSGGLDSSILHSLLCAQGLMPNSATLIFEEEDSKEDIGLSALESKWPNSFERVNTPPIESDVYNWQPEDCYFYEPNLTLFKPLLQKAKAQGLADFWTGLGSDEVFVLSSCLEKVLLKKGDWKNFAMAFSQNLEDQSSYLQESFSLLKEFLPRSLKLKISQVFFQLFKNPVNKLNWKLRRDRLVRATGNPIRDELTQRLYFSGYVSYLAECFSEMAYDFGVHISYPYLDLRVIRAAMALTQDDYYHKGLGKYALRKSFKDIVPAQITDRSSPQGYDIWLKKVWQHQEKALEPVFKRSLLHKPVKINQSSVSEMANHLYTAQFSNWERK